MSIVLNQVFDKETVHVHIMHGDITTRTGVASQNIIAKVGNEVKAYATSNHYKASDFKQIIHIVDTGAAYLPEGKVLEDLRCEELSYQDDGIHTNDVSAFMDFMCESPFSIKGDFKESWEFIEEGSHSIERYTNLPICLEEVRDALCKTKPDAVELI